MNLDEQEIIRFRKFLRDKPDRRDPVALKEWLDEYGEWMGFTSEECELLITITKNERKLELESDQT